MDGRIFHIRQKLAANLGHHWTVSEMANITDVSEPHFIRLFRQCVGVTPIDYLSNLRMDKAKELLETTFVRVKEIGVQIGMSNESQFAREFKKRFGSTPTEYRQQHWETQQSAVPDVQE